MKKIEVKDSFTDAQLAVLDVDSLDNIEVGKRLYLDKEYSIREINQINESTYEMVVLDLE